MSPVAPYPRAKARAGEPSGCDAALEFDSTVTASTRCVEHLVEVGGVEHRVCGVAAEGLVETEVRCDVAVVASASCASRPSRSRYEPGTTLDVVDRHEMLEQGGVAQGEVTQHGACCDAEPPGEQFTADGFATHEPCRAASQDHRLDRLVGCARRWYHLDERRRAERARRRAPLPGGRGISEIAVARSRRLPAGTRSALVRSFRR